MPEEINIPDEEEPISLEGDSLTEGGEAKPTAVKTFGTATNKLGPTKELTRKVNVTGAGATRCRVFYSKVSIAALVHMEQQINEWLDANHYEVKHVSQVIGIMEGKTQEANLIVTVWY